MMKNVYYAPDVRVCSMYFEKNTLYSGLKDMTDNPVCPEDDLDGDN